MAVIHPHQLAPSSTASTSSVPSITSVSDHRSGTGAMSSTNTPSTSTSPSITTSQTNTEDPDDPNHPRASAEGEDEAWDLMDALYSGSRAGLSRSDTQGSDSGSILSHSLSLRSALSDLELEAISFGPSLSRQTSREVLQAEEQEGGGIEIPHFPPLSEAMLGAQQDAVTRSDGSVPDPAGGNGMAGRKPRTSEPIRPIRSHPNSVDQEKALLAHVSREGFQQLVESPMGMRRFRQWIEEEGYTGSKACLSYYDDSKAYEAYLSELAAATKAMQGVYFEPGSALSRTLTARPVEVLPALGSVSLAISSAQTEALDRLYAAEFKRFIAGKITEHARARLGNSTRQQERGDLGEVFCIANPNLPDQPLVMVSDGFCRLSEYPRESLVGRNCRFLQGPATDPEAVRLLREAIAAGKEHCSLLLNYTRTGKPFWNLFNLIPLRNASGHIDLFLGAQVDVSKALTSRETFDALTGLAQSGEARAVKGANGDFGFSEPIIKKMDVELDRSTVLRQTPTITTNSTMPSPFNTFSPPMSPSLSVGSPTLSPAATLSGGNNGPTSKVRRSTQAVKVFRMLTRSGSDNGQTGSSQSGPSAPQKPISIVQQVPDSVREHMTSFSSAYSKLFVVNGPDRRVSYVTPPLLAELGYSVRTQKERLSSPLIGKDLLDLVVGENPTETDALRRVITQVIGDTSHHSLFAGIVTRKERVAVAALPEASYGTVDAKGRSATSSTSSSGSVVGEKKNRREETKFVRSLVHLTPVQGRRTDPVIYVVVVG